MFARSSATSTFRPSPTTSQRHRQFPRRLVTTWGSGRGPGTEATPASLGSDYALAVQPTGESSCPSKPPSVTTIVTTTVTQGSSTGAASTVCSRGGRGGTSRDRYVPAVAGSRRRGASRDRYAPSTDGTRCFCLARASLVHDAQLEGRAWDAICHAELRGPADCAR